MSRTLLNNVQENFSGAITSDTNPGSAGGSRNYVNIGGIKLCWGVTSTVSMTSSAQKTAVVTFPTSFFSAAPVVTLGGIPTGTVYGSAHINSAPTSSSVTLALDATTGTQTEGMVFYWFAIGT